MQTTQQESTCQQLYDSGFNSCMMLPSFPPRNLNILNQMQCGGIRLQHQHSEGRGRWTVNSRSKQQQISLFSWDFWIHGQQYFPILWLTTDWCLPCRSHRLIVKPYPQAHLPPQPSRCWGSRHESPWGLVKTESHRDPEARQPYPNVLIEKA